MVDRLIVVGIGPGDPAYMIPKAQAAIDQADVVIGGRRAIETLVTHTPQCLYITGRLDELKLEMETLPKAAHAVVLVSGDPGYYSLLPWLKKTFPTVKIEVIPGLSSIQVAFSRLAEVWQDATLLSFHGRIPAEKDLVYEKGKKLAFLTDSMYTPSRICQILIDKGWPRDVKAAMIERISYADERRFEGSLESCVKVEGFSHSVLVVMS